MRYINELLEFFGRLVHPEMCGPREIDLVSHDESSEWESALANSYYRELSDYTDVGLSRGRVNEIIHSQFDLEMAARALRLRLLTSQSALWAGCTDVTKQECDEMNFDLEIASKRLLKGGIKYG